MLESKVSTLSLVLRRIYSSEGDAGLRRYFADITQLEDLLDFSNFLDLTTPMIFPRRTASSSINTTSDVYEWGSTFDETEVDSYFEQLRVPRSEPPIGDEMDTDPPAPPPTSTDLHSHREPSPLVPRKRARFESPVAEASEVESGAEDESSASSEESESEPAPVLKTYKKVIKAPRVASTSATTQPVPRPVSKLERKQLAKIAKQSNEPRRK